MPGERRRLPGPVLRGRPPRVAAHLPKRTVETYTQAGTRGTTVSLPDELNRPTPTRPPWLYSGCRTSVVETRVRGASWHHEAECTHPRAESGSIPIASAGTVSDEGCPGISWARSLGPKTRDPPARAMHPAGAPGRCLSWAGLTSSTMKWPQPAGWRAGCPVAATGCVLFFEGPRAPARRTSAMLASIAAPSTADRPRVEANLPHLSADDRSLRFAAGLITATLCGATRHRLTSSATSSWGW